MRIRVLLIVFLAFSNIQAQTPSFDDFFNSAKDSYNSHKNNAIQNYISFREKANKEYVEFLKTYWEDYDKSAPTPRPVEPVPIPPLPFDSTVSPVPVTIIPDEIPTVAPITQPEPIEPVIEQSVVTEETFHFRFYGTTDKIRLPKSANIRLSNCSVDEIAEKWDILSDKQMDNALSDCLRLRKKYNLCDWAYLELLNEIALQYCNEKNGATLLMAYLFCQSGYQMRLGLDGNELIMLFGSRHQIFDLGYFDIDGTLFYPYGAPSNSILICNAEFAGEQPLSLYIDKEQLLGNEVSPKRHIMSKQYPSLSIMSAVPSNIIAFYDTYPTSALNGNIMTRWAMYANTPLAEFTKAQIYPQIKSSIENSSQVAAANMILNLVQTGFEYEYDDKVWGHDRAFFAEESLFYPYCDCEDRSILFSRIIRDLLNLDVALIYYPGHLATAVKFTENVSGDAIIIDGENFIVCDPTYIGAPVVAQMPGLDYNKTQAIVLKK